MVLILNNQDLESVLNMPACIDALYQGLKAYVCGDAARRPRPAPPPRPREPAPAARALPRHAGRRPRGRGLRRPPPPSGSRLRSTRPYTTSSSRSGSRALSDALSVARPAALARPGSVFWPGLMASSRVSCSASGANDLRSPS